MKVQVSIGSFAATALANLSADSALSALSMEDGLLTLDTGSNDAKATSTSFDEMGDHLSGLIANAGADDITGLSDLKTSLSSLALSTSRAFMAPVAVIQEKEAAPVVTKFDWGAQRIPSTDAPTLSVAPPAQEKSIDAI